jgi:hypothetical protein
VIVVLIVLQRSVPVDAHAIDEIDDTTATTDDEPNGAPSGVPPRLSNRVFSAAFSTQALSVFAQHTLLLVAAIVLDDRGWGTGAIGVALSTLTLGMIVMGPLGAAVPLERPETIGGERTGIA